MKKLILILMLFTGMVNAQIVNIPDANFKAKLLSASNSNTIAKDLSGNFTSVDTNSNGEIEFTEALNISYLDVNQSSIADMTGIESLTNLTYLDCRSNLVLTNLDVSNLTNLTYLNAFYAGLTSITLTPSIVNLDISANNLTGSLDLTTFTNLQTFKSGPYNGLTALNLSGLTNLTTIDCSSNSLTSLNVTGCTQLQSLTCYENNLSTLNCSGLTALITMDCSYNQISTLDLLQTSNLLSLQCETNQISSLDLSQSNELIALQCSNNVLSTLNVSSLPNLAVLDFNANAISTIDLSNNLDLQILKASGSNLTTLDLSNNSQLSEVYVTVNPFLTYIALKNGSQETIVAFDDSTNIQFVCVDDNEIPFIQQQLDIALVENAVVNSYCSFTPGGNYNIITGNITFDYNNNGCDPSDIIQPNVRVDINDGTNQGATFSNETGNYTFYTPTGTFNLSSSIENPTWYTINPATATIPFSNTNNNVTIQDFCIVPNGIHHDLEIILAIITPARPGFDAEYQIVYSNKGNSLFDVGEISLAYDESVLDYVSSSQSPLSQNSGVINWAFSNLLPFETRTINLTLNVNSPLETPPVTIDDVLMYTVNCYPSYFEENTNNNQFILNQTVVGSFDPNDIICLEGDIVTPNEIGEYLHYSVSFENTGNYYAENVVVKLDIDATKYDISTLQLLNTSHPSYTRITGNKVEFIFEGINLDAASGNPPVGGHGNVLFKIRSKDDLNNGDSVAKRANIFFDYNAPIDTNMAVTTFQSLNNSIFEFDESITVFPNPTNSNININSKFNIKTIELYDIQGRILETALESSNTTTLDISNRENGIYFLKINTENGSKVEKIVKE